MTGLNFKEMQVLNTDCFCFQILHFFIVSSGSYQITFSKTVCCTNKNYKTKKKTNKKLTCQYRDPIMARKLHTMGLIPYITVPHRRPLGPNKIQEENHCHSVP